MTIPIITGHTGFYGLLGYPISHSLSPQMHNMSFQALGMDDVYLCFPATEESLEEAVNGLKSVGIKGFNTTMPCKNRMAELCDTLSPAAKLLRAVNTVVNTDGKLTGHITDGYGFWETARENGFEQTGKTATLMGMGGAAAAIAVQGALDGLEELHIYVRQTSRFWNRGESIAEELNKNTNCSVKLIPHEDTFSLRHSLEMSDLFINGTSVGMSPNTGETILPDVTMLRPDLMVADVIYNPMETLLLKQAAQVGCKTFNGLYMLLHQGAAAFEIWTGQKMPVELVRKQLFT